MAYKPILFNAVMVRAIQEGRKTQTRRVVKDNSVCRPCDPGDILWVRETWHKDAGRYMYRANYREGEKFYRNGKEVMLRWHPSIHMPKEAARIFLRVKDVRVEQLREITASDAMDEGVTDWNEFVTLWNTTINPADIDNYGWDANPWVWVIEFERCEKPEGWPQ